MIHSNSRKIYKNPASFENSICSFPDFNSLIISQIFLFPAHPSSTDIGHALVGFKALGGRCVLASELDVDCQARLGCFIGSTKCVKRIAGQ